VRRLPALGLLLVSAAAIAARRPDVFTRPQFWAEDGMEWYARAYNEPWLANLLAPYGGYLQLVPRLVGIASQLVPFSRAPLLMAIVALAVQSIAPVFLITDRFAWAVPRRAVRILLAMIVIAVPNLMEVHVNLTNVHVHLGFLALLVVIAEPRGERAWRVFDVAVLLLSGFSGPFCLLLSPVAAVAWWHRRDRWSLVRLCCVAVPALIQLMELSPRATPPSDPTSRGFAIRAPFTPDGATPTNLLRIFGGQIVAGALLGWHVYVGLYAGAFAAHPWLPLLLGLLGVAFLARAARVTDNFALRLLLLYATLHLSAGLASPIIIGDRPPWELLAIPGAGQRYYYTMTLAFLATLVWTVAADPRHAMRVGAALLLVLATSVGVYGDWQLPPREDFDFPAQAERFAQSPAGEVVRIPTPPTPFAMVLVRGCEEPYVPVVREGLDRSVVGEAETTVNPRRERRLRSRRACPDRSGG
jgi:hypothetical protein